MCVDEPLALFDYIDRTVQVTEIEISNHSCLLNINPDSDLFATCVTRLPGRTLHDKYRLTFLLVWYPALERALRRWVKRRRKIRLAAARLIEATAIEWLYRPGGSMAKKMAFRFNNP